MFTREELIVLINALSQINIKGSEAMYIATLISKCNEEVNKIDAQSIEKEQKLDKLKENLKNK